jgi:predicted permease
MFWPIFNQTAVLLTFMVIGFLLLKWKLVPDNTDSALSRLEKYVFVPALVLNTFISRCTLDALSAAWRLFLLGICFASIVIPFSLAVARVLFKDKTLRDIASYALTFSNYGYMGNAIMLAVFPNIFFEYTIFTLPFTLLLYIWGVPVLLLKDKEGIKDKKKQLPPFINPMFASMLIGITIGLSGLRLPTFLDTAIDTAANCMSPVAMLLTGMVIAKLDIPQFIKRWRIYVFVGVKLLVVPLLYVLLAVLLPQNTFITQTALICGMCYASMPTGLNAVILPAAYGKDVSDAAGMACVSHLLSILTIPLMFMLFQTVVL